MKRSLYVAVAVCFAAILLLALPSAFAAEEKEQSVWLRVNRAQIPAGTVRMDLLVPAEEANTVDFNAENGAQLGVGPESEIAALDADGYLSLTFRTAAPLQEADLTYQIFFSVSSADYEKDPAFYAAAEGFQQDNGGTLRYMIPMTVGAENEAALLALAGQIPDSTVEAEAYTGFVLDSGCYAPGRETRFSAVRAAYLDAAGRVLGVTGICPLHGEGYAEDLYAGGETLAYYGEAEREPQPLDYYYNPILPILFAACGALLVIGLLLALIFGIRHGKKRRRADPSDPC